MSKGRLDAILDGLGIKLVPVYRRRAAAQSHARGTMWEILNEYGTGHLVFTLRCIKQTKGNRDALWSETIGAVSDVLVQRPDWAERASELFSAMDGIDLNETRRRAVNRRPWPVRGTLRSYLYLELERRLDDKIDRDLFGEAA